MFLTHLNSDHVVGIPDVWLTGWIPAAYGRRSVPLEVLGPLGTKNMINNLVKAFAWDINIRSKENNKADNGSIVNAVDIEEGFVWEKNRVRVAPFAVRHAEFIDSADTRYRENLIRFAKGADVIVHEVTAANEQSMQNSD